MSWLDYNPRMDHYYDPPEPPTHGKCAGCGEVFDYGDMTTINFKDYCKDCQDWITAENEAEAADLAKLEEE